LDEAEDIYHQTIQLLSADDAPKDAITTSDLAFAHAGLSMIMGTRGRYVEAEAEARRSLELYESSFPPGNPIVGAAVRLLRVPKMFHFLIFLFWYLVGEAGSLRGVPVALG
jgi:hypothetical protein